MTLTSLPPAAPPVACAVYAALTAAGHPYSAPGPAPVPGFVLDWVLTSPGIIYVAHWECALEPWATTTPAQRLAYAATVRAYADALAGADAGLLLSQIYHAGRLELVVCQAAPATRPAPPCRPAVDAPLPIDPTERDLWDALQATAAWDGAERRTRERTALDAWLTWAARGTVVNWTSEATPPPLTAAYRTECQAALRGEGR